MDFRTRSVTSVSVDVMRRSYASFAIMARLANSKSENCDLGVLLMTAPDAADSRETLVAGEPRAKSSADLAVVAAITPLA